MNVIAQKNTQRNSTVAIIPKHFTQKGNWQSIIRDGNVQLTGETENHDLYFTISDDQIILDDSATLILPILDKYALSVLAEALFSAHPARGEILLPGPIDPEWLESSIRVGLVTKFGGKYVIQSRNTYQLALNWLAKREDDVFPVQYTSTNGRRHPVRRPSASHTVYSRYIPWIDATISFERVEPSRHLKHFHKWMNDPRVDIFWEEAGTEEKHLSFLKDRLSDPRTEPLIGYFDGKPFGYFELYWAQEDRLGEHYQADDFDRGWHVAIGEDDFRGKHYLTAWLPSLMHYMFLDDPRTMRIVGEPDASHDQQIRNLMRSGFAGMKQVRFPHKTSLLVMLQRERFFDDRLYVPQFIRDEDAS